MVYTGDKHEHTLVDVSSTRERAEGVRDGIPGAVVREVYVDNDKIYVYHAVVTKDLELRQIENQGLATEKIVTEVEKNYWRNPSLYGMHVEACNVAEAELAAIEATKKYLNRKVAKA